MNARSVRFMLAIATIVCGAILSARNADAILIGPDSGGVQTALDVSGFDANGPIQWSIGSLGAPIDVGFDGDAGGWIKSLIDSPTALLGTTWNVQETIRVQDGSPDLTDWHIDLLTEGFTLIDGSATVGGEIVAAGQANATATTMDYLFDQTLSAGTLVVINYALQWNGTLGTELWAGAPLSIQIAQVPSIDLLQPVVPEPASLSLLAIGLSLVGAVARTRARSGPHPRS